MSADLTPQQIEASFGAAGRRSFVGTCDAGHCDDLTAALVFIPEDDASGEQWLSMCAFHGREQLDLMTGGRWSS